MTSRGEERKERLVPDHVCFLRTMTCRVQHAALNLLDPGYRDNRSHNYHTYLYNAEIFEIADIAGCIYSTLRHSCLCKTSSVLERTRALARAVLHCAPRLVTLSIFF
jgi:hypothetical protein